MSKKVRMVTEAVVKSDPAYKEMNNCVERLMDCVYAILSYDDHWLKKTELERIDSIYESVHDIFNTLQESDAVTHKMMERLKNENE